MSPSSEWEAEADDLYALDAAEFVTARNALARRLKADGRKDEAAEVGRMRKPSVVAAALNRVARDDPDRIEALLDAAARATRAQQDLLEGGEASALRAATGARRTAARAVVAAAVELVGTGQADAVRTTLDAAVADPDLVPRLRAGTLTDTLSAPAGFGFGSDDASGPAAPPTRRRRPPTSAPAGGAHDAGPDPTTTEAAEAAEAARKEARALVAKLERELARAEKWAAKAAESADAAAQELVTAGEALAAARQRVDDARVEEERTSIEAASREDDRHHQAALLDQARRLVDELDG